MRKEAKALADSLLSIVDDVAYYLREIDPAVYRTPIPALSDATIGQHTRHFIEFFQCLYRQFNEEGKLIDYGARKRDVRIETDPEFALDCFQTVVRNTVSQSGEWDHSLRLRHDSDMPDAVVDSSYSREIFYGVEHSIHHLAIIKIGLKDLAPEIQLPDHFGIAPSTIKYRNSQCAQ